MSTGLAAWTSPLLDLQKDEQPQHVYFDSTEGESQSNDDSQSDFEESEAASEDSHRDGEEAASEDEPLTDADEQTPSAAGRDLTERATSVDGVEADSSSQQVGLEACMLQAWGGSMQLCCVLLEGLYGHRACTSFRAADGAHVRCV